MGDTAEQMAKSHGISRAAQDELAHRSHTLAAAAWQAGKLADEVMTALIKAVDGLAVQLINTQVSPAAAMASWLKR